MSLMLELAAGRPAEAQDCQVTVYAEGVQLLQQPLPDDPSPHTLLMPVADLANKGSRDLELTISSNTWVPDEYNGQGDRRRLGLLYYGAQVRPASPDCVGEVTP